MLPQTKRNLVSRCENSDPHVGKTKQIVQKTCVYHMSKSQSLVKNDQLTWSHYTLFSIFFVNDAI